MRILSWKALVRIAVVGMTLVPASAVRADTVKLAPGADGLGAAIAAAGPGGTIIVQPGLHTESGTVVISAPVTIVGKPGAVLESVSVPSVVYPLEVHAAIHVMGTPGVAIKGLQIRPPDGTEGNTGIMLENAPGTLVSGTQITNEQFGILVRGSDDVEIAGTTIAAASGWTVGEFPEGHGIVVIGGARASIHGNNVSGALFDIWACDRDGSLAQNVLSDAFAGLVLCRVPDGNFLISGSDAGAPAPASGWIAVNNEATGNAWGYLVIDGAHDNTLTNNDASGNSTYDIELAGDTSRFGTPLATSSRTQVTIGSAKNLTIKDCGQDDQVNAATIDTTVDPCY